MPEMTADQVFELALQHQRAGRMREAEALYRQVLERQPRHAGAYHGLGILAHQAGQRDRAIELLQQAIALNPGDALAHTNLGEVYRSAGRLDEALACGQQALQRDPALAAAHHLLGTIRRDRAQWDEAILSSRRALEIQPSYPEAQANLGIALAGQKKFPEAVAAYRDSLRQRPHSPETLNNLGIALRQLGQFPEAIAAYREALRQRPDYSKAHYHLGNVLKDQGRLDEAAACFLRTLDLEPHWHDAHLNLGMTRLQQHRLADAEAHFRRAVAARPDSADAHVNLGTLLLLLGRHEEGWKDYEWRLKSRPSPYFSVPARSGAPVAEATLPVHAEQGYGDTLQFVRYLPLLRERALVGRVILESPPALVPLLQQMRHERLEIVASCDAIEGAALSWDHHIPLLSLPLALRQFEPLSTGAPYLRADEGLRARWRARFPAGTGLKVGIVTTGNPSHQNNAQRSIDPGQFSALLKMPGITFVNLHVRPELSPTPELVAAGALDFAAGIVDFAELAALITELDLVITVDTSAAHLAGALGSSVWVLLSFTPDWRWGLNGTGTPWYPTMRLFRQSAPDDWRSAMQEVGSALEGYTAARRRCHEPDSSL